MRQDRLLFALVAGVGQLGNDGGQMQDQLLVVHCALHIFKLANVTPHHLAIDRVLGSQALVGSAGQIETTHKVTATGQGPEGASANVAKGAGDEDVHAGQPKEQG